LVCVAMQGGGIFLLVLRKGFDPKGTRAHIVQREEKRNHSGRSTREKGWLGPKRWLLPGCLREKPTNKGSAGAKP